MKIIAIFNRYFAKDRRVNVRREVPYSEDYRRGYNNMWIRNMKNYWP